MHTIYFFRVLIQRQYGLKVRDSCQGDSMVEALLNWTQNSANRPIRLIRALPLIICWGIWLARNNSIFHDPLKATNLVATQGLSILSFPQEKGALAIRIITEESINKQIPSGYFDGAAQGVPSACGGGSVLYLSDTHFFKIKARLGNGSNNFAELLSFKLLLLFALEKGCHNIQMFSDSMLVINWVKEVRQCHNVQLDALLEEIKLIKIRFDSYKERNRIVDALSKEGMQLDVCQWIISEHQNEDHFEFYHRLFIEGTKLQQGIKVNMNPFYDFYFLLDISDQKFMV